MAEETKELGSIGIDDSGFPTMREPIKISLSSYNKSKFLDIRKFYFKDNELCPTQKGITISNEKSFLELLELLEERKEEIKEWIKEVKK
ncbi:MAG TPA: transcriptional coactivator p15/PC4 family protein [Spirochaetota bacterium]|nr:transcriptional coactivator p15/PC4 family protein [Spirochaetota bacterium]